MAELEFAVDCIFHADILCHIPNEMHANSKVHSVLIAI